MFQNSAFRQDALNMESIKDKTEDWKKTRNEKYIREAGWHFKTLAVQEVGAYKVFHGFCVFLTYPTTYITKTGGRLMVF